MKKHRKYRLMNSVQMRKLILKDQKEREERLKDNRRYNLEHMFDDLTYEGGLRNFFTVIDVDRVDILEEHFRRGERKLNKNYDFRSSLGFVLELPLIRAIKARSYCTMICLLEHGAHPDVLCLATKMTPYQYAEKNDRKALRIFNDFKNGIKTRVKCKYQYDDVKLFPDVEEDQDDRSEQDDSMNVFDSISSDREDILKEHLDKGFRTFNKNIVYPAFSRSLFDLPLIVALKHHSYKCLKLLLEYGANPESVCGKVWMTPLQYAKENDEKTYRIIIEFIESLS